MQKYHIVNCHQSCKVLFCNKYSWNKHQRWKSGIDPESTLQMFQVLMICLLVLIYLSLATVWHMVMWRTHNMWGKVKKKVWDSHELSITRHQSSWRQSGLVTPSNQVIHILSNLKVYKACNRFQPHTIMQLHTWTKITFIKQNRTFFLNKELLVLEAVDNLRTQLTGLMFLIRCMLIQIPGILSFILSKISY